ncbi:tubulin-specific chaperone-like protein E [Glonium stellatum]|uniref:Tubulin-specific chaperone-like protein E n=1 Tax=Glonium stellatum TaxID=574774 RepID=A0A8E2F9S7_9PEZI|nr:tubulin-specific chaperone-like protein E [Glonium stellatum]
MATNFYNGKRLSFDGQLCTVRYFGEVQGTKGEWLGVEWDDPTRGKHSGENGGIRYFECVSKLPTAASFVRPTRRPDPPRSFVEALRHKYASEDFEDPDVKIVYIRKDKNQAPSTHHDKPVRISGKEVEEVGFDKIRKQLADLHELKIVLLDGLCVSRPIATLRERFLNAGSPAEPAALTDIKDTCPKIVELDLSRNLFEEWREIVSICEQLDRLKSLRVDGNRFRDVSLSEAERTHCATAFANIKTLKMEDTLLSWHEIADLATLFPYLNSFVASSNALGKLENGFLPSTITDLTLEENGFHALSDLLPLTKLPNLQRLILKNNKIAEIVTPGSETPVFPSMLSEVNLSYNEIASWAFIDRLEDVFPGLTAIRVAHNPLYQSLYAADGRALSVRDGYMLTLARLGRLKNINYSPITPKERLDAEIYYLSQIGKELSANPQSKEAAIIASHRRYAELCEEYGDPNVHRSTTLINPNSLAARLIKFSFRLSESAERVVKEDVPRSFTAEIPTGFTVYSALGIVGKKFGLPPMKLRLVWETGDWVPAGWDALAVGTAWDSESSEEEDEKGLGVERIPREVELVAGTRTVGTWVDGVEANVRVELK